MKLSKRFLCAALALVLCFGMAASGVMNIRVHATGSEVTLDASTLGTETTEFTSISGGPITMSAVKGDGSTKPAYNKAKNIRLYTSNVATISASSGYKITKIVITATSDQYGITANVALTNATADSYGASTTLTVTDPTKPVVLINNKTSEADGQAQIRITSVVVTYELDGVDVDSMSLAFNGHSLVLDAELEIRYYLDLSKVQAYTECGYRIWDKSEGSAVPGDEAKITTEILGDTFKTATNDASPYVSNGLIAAKDINKEYYIQAYVKVGGDYIYSNIEEYSVAAYEALVNAAQGETVQGFNKAKLLATIDALQAYGTAAEALFAVN